SLDLVECLLSLSEYGHYEDVKTLFQNPIKLCPDLLTLSILQSGNSWGPLRRDLLLNMVPVFLGSHPNSAMVLNFVWSAQSSMAKQILMHSMAEWYMRNEQFDQQKLSRILDVAQDLKALSMLLSHKPFTFVIDLATLASRREYLKLDKWLSDKIREHREEFIEACINFLKRRCPAIVVSRIPVKYRSEVRHAVDRQQLQQLRTVGHTTIGLQWIFFISVRSRRLSNKLPDIFSQNKSAIGGKHKIIPVQFNKEIEDEANGYFQRIYNQPPHPTLSVDDILELLQTFKESSNKKEREVFSCMMRNLFEEYRFFPQYPDKELHITACLFGGIIEKNLVTYMALGIALRYVLEALRKMHNTKMYYFGIAALDRFKGKLKDYPQYCCHISGIAHFNDFPSHLVEVALPNFRLIKLDRNHPGVRNISSQTPNLSLYPSPQYEKIPEPPESLQDKVAFIFNNLSVSNMGPKADEMRDAIKEEHTPWLSQYLVMKRVSIEPNFHLLYSNFLDCLKIPILNNLVKEEVFRNITVLLKSDKTVANFSDRSLLKNLGHFLGIITLSKNSPIFLHYDIDLKSLLYEAYSKGAQELLYVVPFVAKVLESVGKSKVFKLPNPWTEAIMSVLVELHREPDLKLNLKFEVEVLCKNLNIELQDITPANYLKDPEIKFKIDCQVSFIMYWAKFEPMYALKQPLSTSKKESGASSKPSTPSEQPLSEFKVVPSSVSAMGLAAPSLSSGFPPPPSLSQPQQISHQPMSAMTPRFSFHDINVYSIATLQSHLTIKMELPLLQANPQLKACVRPAVERGVQDLLQPAVERAIKIALTTCEQIVRKDFALDPEEFRMRTAAHHMVRNLTAGMALITCREQLLQSIISHLKQNFGQAIVRVVGQQQKEMIEQAALNTIYPPQEFELRKLARQEGRRYCDPGVLTYQAERMPEQIRLKVGGVTPQQTAVYEEFARCIPGFLPSNDSSQPSGFLAKPMQYWHLSYAIVCKDLCEIKTNYIHSSSMDINSEIRQLVTQTLLKLHSIAGNNIVSTTGNQFSQLQTLHEAIVLARNSREIVTALALLQKAVEGLLDASTLTTADQEVRFKVNLKYLRFIVLLLIICRYIQTLVRYRECHVIVLKSLQDQRAYGPLWTNKQVTQCLVNHRDEYKYNVEAVELLIRSHLVNMQQYDQHLAQVTGEKLGVHTLNLRVKLGLYTLNPRVKLEVHTLNRRVKLRVNTLKPGVKLGVNTTFYWPRAGKKGFSAREYDDPPGLHEKTEYLLREWVNIYHSPSSGLGFILYQMHQQGILRTDDLITRFFRLCTEMCESNVSPSLLNPTLVRAKCFHTLDAFVRLITLLVKHSGDAVNSVTKINLLNKVLGIVVGVLLQDHETRQTEYHQMPYHRIFIMLFYELNAPEHVLESINFQTLTAFTNTYHILRPSKAPGFAFAWLEVISYRSFISRMLLHTPQQKGWPMYAQLLIDLFKFLAPFLRNVELTKSIQILYRGTLRLLLVLLHDFPEFLCDYHYGFCDVIPANCIQLRNLILSAFPRNMRLPDPFTPNLKVDMLQEINVAPRILTNFIAVMPAAFTKDLDSYLKTRAPVTFLSDLRTNLQVTHHPTMHLYLIIFPTSEASSTTVPLINSLVLHVGMQAIAYIHSKGSSPSMATITHSSHMDIFQNLAVDLDTEGRYLFLNAIANQLRYPNSHTHYFSCTLLYLFAETNQESIQEQITRVLLERLIVNRPHPWGLLITFIELIK
uniref:CCR4-NOT transcription complex subunit 1 n=1 Tax=Ciona savignyi TaxID=51511 RepID=H2YFJ7_CIOSA